MQFAVDGVYRYKYLETALAALPNYHTSVRWPYWKGQELAVNT